MRQTCVLKTTQLSPPVWLKFCKLCYTITPMFPVSKRLWKQSIWRSVSHHLRRQSPSQISQRTFKCTHMQRNGRVNGRQEFEQRNVVLKAKDGKLAKLSERHKSYDALQYPLLFTRGEDGYHFIFKQTEQGQGQSSATNFYTCRLMIRTNHFNKLHYFRRLLSKLAALQATLSHNFYM